MTKKETKLSINLYLFKEHVNDLADAVKVNLDSVKEFDANEGKIFLFSKNNKDSVPDWAKKIKAFCGDETISLFSSSCSVVLVIKADKSNRLFALCFGYGRNMLNLSSIEDDFGLKTVLNVIDHNKIKSVDIKNLDTVIKNVRMDNSKETDFGSFGANIEKDVLNGVVGVIKENSSLFPYAKKVCGKEAIKFNTAISIANLPNLCFQMLSLYKRHDYKEHFTWIDHVKIIKQDYALINTLDALMISLIHKEKWEKVWLSPPEVIDWYKQDAFKYSPSGELYEDIGVKSWLKSKKKLVQDVNIDILKNSKVYSQNIDGDISHDTWSVYKCVYCEVEYNSNQYVLFGGNWYNVNKNYYQDINMQLSHISDYQGACVFPNYDEIEEKVYNQKVVDANSSKSVLMDRKNISYGGGHSSIELCDVFFNESEFIHVKRYNGSSVLSHLFFQGLNSAFLIKTDNDFFIKANDKLREYTTFQFKESIDASNFEVVYAIAAATIDRNIKDFIPFFSKVSLVHTAKQLKAYGYRVSIKKILLDSDAIDEKQEILNREKKEKAKKNNE